jgi:cell volume regulation protein A
MNFAGAEPAGPAIFLLAAGVLLAVGVASSRPSARLGVPLALVYLLVGIIAGSEGLGGIAFENYHVTYRLGIAALVVILFDGGLQTPMRGVRSVAVPSLILATLGVIGTAAVTAVAAHFLGFSWTLALLIGAIVSSTDAAAVFSVLSASGTQLRERIGLTLEVESGINDPTAIILTTALTAHAIGIGSLSPLGLLRQIVVELAIGGVLGYGIGRGGRFIIGKLRLPASGLYPAFTIGLACLAYGLPTLVHGSGFLAVYIAGLTVGNGPLAHGTNLRRVHDAMGWLAQIGMFLMLGLLVFPSRLLDVAPIGLGIGLTIALVARPAVVALCLLPFRYSWRESLYVGFVGLRGAVPIVLATIPVMAGVGDARELFDVVFFVTVVGAIVPGATVPYITRLLGLEANGPPRPKTTIEIDAQSTSGVELHSYYVQPSLAVAGARLRDIPFPENASVTVVERAGELVAPSADLELLPGDHVFVIASRLDRPFIELLFGVAEDH